MNRKKFKASLNKAARVETRPPNQNIENMSSEDLALLLNDFYQRMMQMQGNILAVNQLLEKRKQQKLAEAEKAKTLEEKKQ